MFVHSYIHVYILTQLEKLLFYKYITVLLFLPVISLGKSVMMTCFEVKECVELYLQSPNTSSWDCAWLSTGTTLSFTFVHNL
jgi:hypothetical protein